MTALPRISVLDHGYIEHVESWGSDEAIVSAARMSTQKGLTSWGPHYQCEYCNCKWRNNHDGSISLFDTDQTSCGVCEGDTIACSKTFAGDEKLLGFLWKNKHSTPFEFGGMTIEVQAPLFVFREWHRHRTQSYSEASARYSPLPDLNYIPTVERLMANVNGTNKQAGTVKGAPELTLEAAEKFRHAVFINTGKAEELYQEALADGVPKELARIHLPVGRYSKMRASSNLRNWLQFLALRLPENAQYEIRVYAQAVKVLLTDRFPRTLALFEETMSHGR